MNFWQWVAVIIIILIFSFGLTILLILRRSLDEENEINRQRFIREQEWHDKEADNWRMVDPALRTRIRELEATCRDNQKTIAKLRMDIASKDDFLAAVKLKDLYENGIFVPRMPNNRN